MKVHPVKSIFVKLLAAYIIAFVIISMGAILTQIYSLSANNTEISMQNIKHYALSLAREIGSPPDISIAKKIADETGLQIMLSGANQEWASFGNNEGTEFPLVSDNESSWHFFPWTKDCPVTINLDGYTYYFNDFHADHRESARTWLIMTISILLALLVSFFIVRHLLKPLRIMNKVALELGISDWKKRANIKGTDELATLGKAMDGMADRIENYIHSMHDLLIAVSHELRSPLTRMKVSLEFIENESIRKSMDEEINTLDQLTENILEQKRLTTQPNILKKEEFPLQGWITSVCKKYQHSGTAVVQKFKGSELVVLLDRARMDLALRNLIENSIRHAPGSTILVSLDTSSKNKFTLEVSDTGPGIDDNLLSRIGEPFLPDNSPGDSNSRRAGGFGLGLSIVKAIAEAHGAVFTVRNLEPGGFSVKLQFDNVQVKK